MIFQTYIVLFNRIHSLNDQTYTTLGSKDIGIGKSEFVAKTLFLWINLIVEMLQLIMVCNIPEQIIGTLTHGLDMSTKISKIGLQRLIICSRVGD